MFDRGWIRELDGSAAAEALDATRVRLLQEEATKLALAAHWVDLHNGDAVDPNGRVVPGTERAVRAGSAGTPEVMEFAAAELAVQLGITTHAGRQLMADAVNLRHRHPLLWQAVLAGEVRSWQACHVARRCAHVDLTLEQAMWVDQQTTASISRLPWTRFLGLLEAKIMAADEEAAEQREQEAASQRFVRLGRETDNGLRSMVARASAGDVMYLFAVVDRLAQILRLRGDTDPADVRRSKALGILATPAVAVQMLADPVPGHTVVPGDPPELHGEVGPHHPTADEPETRIPSEDLDPDLDAVLVELEGTEIVRVSDLHPAHADCDGGTGQGDGCTAEAERTRRQAEAAAAAALRDALAGVDPAKLRPRAVLHVHISEQLSGVARVEGLGPVTVRRLRKLLAGCHLTVKPVLDPLSLTPVDAYEVPDPMRDAVTVLNPFEVFPYGTLPTRGDDADHVVPYVEGVGGQTRIDNLAPLGRLHHRMKTHGRWRLHQPSPGVYLWRTPHGWWYRVDRHGTHRLGKHPDLTRYGIEREPYCLDVGLERKFELAIA